METAIDKVMLYSLMVIGVLSGPASKIQRTSLRYLSSAYHLLICCVPIIVLIMFVESWPTNNSLIVNISLISTSMWLAETALCNVILLFYCHWQNGIRKYHDELGKYTTMLQGIHFNILPGSKSFKVKRNVFAILCWIFGIVPSAAAVYDVIDTSLKDPMLAAYYKQPSRVWFFILSNLPNFHWVFISGYISYTAYTLWVLVSKFNEKLEEDLKSSCKQVLENLHTYRSLHLQLCKVIESANHHMRLLLGILFLFSTIAVLMMIYTVTYLKLVELTAAVWFLYTLFTVTRTGLMMLIIFTCDRMAESVSL